MTYRQAIQIQIAALQQVYDNCGGIRDAATEEEKDYWNKMRGGIGKLWPILQQLDNSISQQRADTPLQGNYIVNEK